MLSTGAQAVLVVDNLFEPLATMAVVSSMRNFNFFRLLSESYYKLHA